MKHLLELLERTAARWPDRLSYCDEHSVHTWAQTAALTAAIGSGLCRAGVQGRPVALYLDHEAPCIHAMLGTLAAGGFYAVLDTAQPAARVRAAVCPTELRVVYQLPHLSVRIILRNLIKFF